MTCRLSSDRSLLENDAKAAPHSFKTPKDIARTSSGPTGSGHICATTLAFGVHSTRSGRPILLGDRARLGEIAGASQRRCDANSRF
jgi:hypothetical protein